MRVGNLFRKRAVSPPPAGRDHPESNSLEDTSLPVQTPLEHAEPGPDTTIENLPDPQLVHSIELARRIARKTAHDFNNILAVIHGFAGILQKRLQHDEANSGIVEQVEASALEALRMTNWLSTFANSRSPELAPLDLNTLVEEWLTGMLAEKPEDVELEMALASRPLPMLGDQAQLEETCRELWSNALESMPHGGRVRWQTTLEELRVSSRPEPRPEGHGAVPFLRLRVTDTGTGMEPETRESMFEPFFTTKSGKDRGLGLSTVYDTVYAHQGFIQVSSDPETGTCVDVYFPAQATESPVEPAPSSTESTSRLGAGQVLVIDDEEMVLEMVRQMLLGQGCEVVGVTSGEAALDAYRQSGGEIGAVVLDMTLPGMGGLETLEKLKELNPEVKVIVATGDPHQQAVHDAVAQGAFGVLSKPFLAEHLTDVVVRALH